MATSHIIGWGHTAFGKFEHLDLEELFRQSALPALERAGLDPRDVDAIFVGTFNGGFVPQDFSASLAGVAIPAFRHTPAVRLENACATGSAAIWAALDAVESGRCRRVLVVGMEKMSAVPSAQVGEILLKCAHVKEDGATPMGFAGVFGRIAAGYFQRFGDQSDALATIAEKNHRHGVQNPYAHLRRDLSFDFCRHASEKNPVVAGPLKRTDCSLVSDGSAALVISADRRAGQPAVRWRSRVQANDFLQLSQRDLTRFDGAALAWSRGLADARVRLDDLQFAEVHDCFTIAELLQVEAMGLAGQGQGARVVLDGVTAQGGRLPLNPSGGLKSRGHPIGATGVSQHVMAVLQLTGQAGGMQVPDARLGAVFNMGGAAVANYLSVLEAV